MNINSLSANFTKRLNILKQFVGNLPTNCLSGFDHFVKLALKGLRFKTFCFRTGFFESDKLKMSVIKAGLRQFIVLYISKHRQSNLSSVIVLFFAFKVTAYQLQTSLFYSSTHMCENARLMDKKCSLKMFRNICKIFA